MVKFQIQIFDDVHSKSVIPSLFIDILDHLKNISAHQGFADQYDLKIGRDLCQIHLMLTIATP